MRSGGVVAEPCRRTIHAQLQPCRLISPQPCPPPNDIVRQSRVDQAHCHSYCDVLAVWHLSAAAPEINCIRHGPRRIHLFRQFYCCITSLSRGPRREYRFQVTPLLILTFGLCILLRVYHFFADLRSQQYL
jgi:hypothetical protein